MTPTRAQLTLQLASIRDRLRALPEVSEVEAVENMSGTPGAAMICDRDAEFAERERLWLSARALRRALDRIDAGEYERCADCGDAIGARRLEALPSTDVCRGCAAEREDRARMALRRGWEEA